MNKVIRISIIIFFIGIIGSFFTIGESLFVGLRYISPIAIILLSLLSKRKIVISKSEMIVLFLFVLIFFIYPITLMLLNIYEIGKQNIIVNSLYYVITIVSCFFIASYYKSTNKQDFFKDFGLVGCIFLIVGLLMFRDISFSISGLLNNLIANERGERSYLGFTNPNQVAILTSLVIHSIIISQLNKKIKKPQGFLLLKLVTSMEFESMNVALRGQCVKPLHQQTINNVFFKGHYYFIIIHFYLQSSFCFFIYFYIFIFFIFMY